MLFVDGICQTDWSASSEEVVRVVLKGIYSLQKLPIECYDPTDVVVVFLLILIISFHRTSNLLIVSLKQAQILYEHCALH